MTDTLSSIASAPGRTADPFARVVDRLGRSPRSTTLVGRWWVAICGLVLIIASDYEYRQRAASDALSGGVDSAIVFELALYALVAGYLAAVHIGTPRPARIDRHLYLAVFFIGLFVLSVAYTPFLLYGAVRAVQMGVVLALVIAASAHATRDHFHRFAHAFLALVSASVILGIIVSTTPYSPSQEGRFTWLAIHPTVSGVLSGLAVVVAVTYLVAGPPPASALRWPKPAYVVALLLTSAGLLGTQTRGAILGTLAASAVVLFTSRAGRAVIDWILAGVVATLGLVLLAGDSITAYFVRGESTEKLSSLNERTVLWDLATEAVAAAPLYGYGITAAQGIFLEETGLGGGHNAVINILVELGVLGVLCWTFLVVTLVVGARRLPRRGSPAGVQLDRSLLLAVITFLLVDGMFYEGAGAVTNVASTWLLLIAGWLTVARRSVPVVSRTND